VPGITGEYLVGSRPASRFQGQRPGLFLEDILAGHIGALADRTARLAPSRARFTSLWSPANEKQAPSLRAARRTTRRSHYEAGTVKVYVLSLYSPKDLRKIFAPSLGSAEGDCEYGATAGTASGGSWET
jgi:hypothetical protein